ncbi:MAG TPA: PD-(D/E)XK nuclease family protein [Kofleriaceae bacterium]|nr:PD-(D/E)XK nuclease family protein [Kofleriaceae bacterium]
MPNIARWADAVIALDAQGSLPTRTVVVPSEAHAHALRVELVGRAPRVLAGTWFPTAAALARAVLDSAEVAYRVGEEVRRRLRFRKLLRTRPALMMYRVGDLGTPGWEEAFAATIEQLELAALRPDDLERIGDVRALDLAAIWRAVDEDAGTSWTVPRLLLEAQRALVANPGAWPIDGPVLASVWAGTDAAHARLLQVIPGLTLGVIAGRPARRRAIERMRSLFGDVVAELAVSGGGGAQAYGELAVLAEYLFEPPERLASAERRRSSGPDGSVTLEWHAGVDDEIDAAARWVAEEVFHHQTPLQDIAILVPNPDPLAALVADRVEALPWPSGTQPVYLACGRPAVSTAAGARLCAIVRAVRACLPAEAMIEILPRLRLAGVDGHLSPGRARALVHELGTIGGSAARPEDARQWCERFAAVELDGELDGSARAVGPAVAALVALVADMVGGAALGSLWQAVRCFVTEQVIAPREMEAILEQLDGEIRGLAEDAVTQQVIGAEAIELIDATLCAMRLGIGRYGEPAVYVGTIMQAAGLPFTAVRVIGLAESVFPGTLRADAILAPDLRSRLPPYSMASDDDYAIRRFHAFDQVVRGVTHRLCVSAPRTEIDGSEREPAALFVEMAAALARPSAITGRRAGVIPTVAELERDAFGVARAAAITRQTQTPLSPACWLDRVAGGARQLPSAWLRTAVTEPGAVRERSTTMLGDLGSLPLTVGTPGLEAERPLSASALRVLLTCPQRFLLERVLGFRSRISERETHRVDPTSYGALFHAVVEALFRTHGLAFCAREHGLAHWLDVGDRAAGAAFDAFLREYPLIGEGVIEGERRRLCRDVRTFLEHDWDAGRPRRFVAVERVFGEAPPVSIATSAGPLFVAGRIDRIDVEGDVAVVRDLKTGRARPREREQVEPDVQLDLQLGVYVAVAERLAAEWSIPAEVSAAYVYVDPLATERERSFRADRHVLRAAGARWFDLASLLIREQRYVRTPDANDCRGCPFSAVCGDDTRAVNEHLREAGGALGAFRELKAATPSPRPMVRRAGTQGGAPASPALGDAGA